MTILALDTTSERGSIAIRRDGRMLSEAQVHSTDGFSHVIFEEMEQALARAGCGVADIDCFAAASGPGSFTGVRVGLTVAKGLAEARQKKVAAVSNLRALATYGNRDRRVVLLDARRGQVYAAVYDRELNAVSPELVTNLNPWLETLPEGEYDFISVSGGEYRRAVAGTQFFDMDWIEAPPSLASAVALCAERDAKAGLLVSPELADANYVRRSDAELFWHDR